MKYLGIALALAIQANDCDLPKAPPEPPKAEDKGTILATHPYYTTSTVTIRKICDEGNLIYMWSQGSEGLAMAVVPGGCIGAIVQ